MPAFMIAATHKSSGKTTISVALAKILANQGELVQTFKKGPDYIDPMWLKAASGRACYNLDFNTMDKEEITELYAQKSQGADISLIEANKGLYDGLELDGSDSNAQLAKLLNLPIILLVDCEGMTRGIAPLLLGYVNFDKEINIVGVILNKVGGIRHENKLRAAIKKYTNLPILGIIEKNELLDIGERHLGLITPMESDSQTNKIQKIAGLVNKNIDLATIKKIAQNAPTTPVVKKEKNYNNNFSVKTNLTIAIARDNAFGFYYEDDLEKFTKLGVRLVEFNCLRDKRLPANIDGLLIGGGFPETHMKQLSENISMRTDIKQSIISGLPTYAECGGLIYLSEMIEWGEEKYEMVGVIKGKSVIHEKPQGRGYVKFENSSNHPWAKAKEQIRAHEFHYSSLEGLAKNTKFARKILRGFGLDGKNDAIIVHNLLAGFCHLRNSKQNQWIKEFVEFVKSKKINPPPHRLI